MFAGTDTTICIHCGLVVPAADGICELCGEIFPTSTINVHVSDTMLEAA